ncbi:unnamed protein product [Chrysodeixis includens]|uniref:DNA ligase n=1 Tax=Chrysodeixis includens TaxID=689277 RepID=A0A9P0BYJ3_CHRIL|nr:unnamed protein product [Chrysodeixis includens]
MFNSTKLIAACRVVRHVHVTVRASALCRFLVNQRVSCISTSMAQRSITSFFKVFPPKSEVKLEKLEIKLEKHEVKQEASDKEDGEDRVSSPTSNGKLKATSKRPRLESSDSDTSTKKHSPTPSSGKKNKVKRQRIESSDSDSMCPDEQQAPPEPLKSPASPQSENKTFIKLEKTSPKIYASPKSKKKQPLKEANPVEERSPKKNKKQSPVGNKNKSPKKEALLKKEEGNKTEVKELVPEMEYNPAKANYHPVEDACWAAGAPVPYLALARTLELIEATSARLKIIDILSNYLRSVIVLTPDDLLPSVYLCLNQLAPAYESLELGVAETYLLKAVGQCTGRTLAQLRGSVAREGDLGRVAQSARTTQRTMFTPPPLSARAVLNALRDIARMTGHASVDKKIKKIQSLYVACRHSEARYLIRSLEGKLRVGLAEQSVLAALGAAAARTPPPGEVLDAARGVSPEQFKAIVDEHALTIKTVYCECPNYELVIPALLQHGVRGLGARCRLQPGIPLKPMLAHPTKQLAHIFDRFEKEEFTCEWKYDGERAQLHVPAQACGAAPDLPRAAIFSRNQENNTTKYPDVLGRLTSLLGPDVTSCVLDCEAVAYDVDTKQILPFQVLSTRKRKAAALADIKVQVCVFVFDLLFLNGEPLVRRPLRERRQLLRQHFRQVPGEWQLATSRDCSALEDVQQFLEEAVRGSCEGLMVKALDGPRAHYDIARRSHNWLKLKKDYLDGLGDTLDVVVVGAYRGRGKRAGVFGGFLLACYEPEHEQFQSLCKIGTGFSDEDLQSLTEQLQKHVIDAPRPYYSFDAQHSPDVWLAAASVWEVRAADLSLSPAHRAAIGRVHPDKGISLRFPRFVRVRDDKTPEQASSAAQIADMYLAQDQVKNTATTNTNMDEFY